MGSRKPYVGLYGNVALLKRWCGSCGREAFCIDGEMACCGHVVADEEPVCKKQIIEPEMLRRTPPVAERHEILNAQGDKCFYCARSFGSTVYRHNRPVRLRINWDHVMPWAYGFNNHAENFVAACHVCNSVKSSRIFRDVEQTAAFIASERERKGYTDVPTVPEEVLTGEKAGG